MQIEKNRILVTGAAGKVGREVIAQLLSAGARVRALVRNPEAASLPREVEVVRGDLAVPATLEESLDGAESVFLVWPFLTADLAPAVLDVVMLSKHVRRVVYLSSLWVRDDVERQLDPIIQFHADLERLIERSGLEWTFLRPSGFARNALGWAPQIRAEGVVRGPYGAAARSPIHERDVAAVAARALAGNGHGGRKLILTGPEVLTHIEQMRAIGEAIGRRLRWEEIPPQSARTQMLSEGWPLPLVDAVLSGWARLVTEPESVTSTVEDITGAPARPFREWARDHAADFR
jgi:uncharacterized protein YbjT (DUF2867 family)